MPNAPKFAHHNIFPTPFMTFNLSDIDFFTKSEVDEMIEDIDWLVDQWIVLPSEEFPQWQTRTIIFEEGRAKPFQKLKKSFILCCEEFIRQHNLFDIPNYEPSSVHAWAYKNWNTLQSNQKMPPGSNEQYMNPIHTHIPNHVSGIFYLKLPKGDFPKNTEFMDPRGYGQSNLKSFIPDCPEMTWAIFPSYLPHRTCPNLSEDPRYIIAANLALKLSEPPFPEHWKRTYQTPKKQNLGFLENTPGKNKRKKR